MAEGSPLDRGGTWPNAGSSVAVFSHYWNDMVAPVARAGGFPYMERPSHLGGRLLMVESISYRGGGERLVSGYESIKIRAGIKCSRSPLMVQGRGMLFLDCWAGGPGAAGDWPVSGDLSGVARRGMGESSDVTCCSRERRSV